MLHALLIALLLLLLLMLIVGLIVYSKQIQNYQQKISILNDKCQQLAANRATTTSTNLLNNNTNLIEDFAFKMNLISESGKMGIWNFNVKTQHFYYVTETSSYFEGFSWQQYLEMVHPDDRHQPANAMTGLLEGTTTSMVGQYRIRIPNSDQYRWFDIYAVLYKRDEMGYPFLITGLRWDITQEMESKERYRINAKRLDLTFSVGGIVPWAFNCRTLMMSSDNESSVFHNNNITVFEYIDSIVHPDHQVLFKDRVQNVLAGNGKGIDIKTLCWDGEQYQWTRIMGEIIEHDYSDTDKMAVGVRRYITDEVEKEKILTLSREKAEESNRLKSAFLANMSHEIRTPLNAIVGFSNLIIQSNTSEETREYGKVIESNTDLLMQLVSDILDISKIEAGLMEFYIESCDVCELLSELLQVFEYRMSADVALLFECSDDKLYMSIDKNRFKQVISNFLTNAIKYTSVGSITVGYRHIDKGVQFYVRDTGKGIAPDNLVSVFDRFSKFDRTIQGTGLGLAICQTIINRLNGQIGVSSELGKGSEFWFTLPSSSLVDQIS